MEKRFSEVSHIQDAINEKDRCGCGGILADGCINGCVSCCFFYVILVVSFVFGIIGLLIFLGWFFSSLFTASGGA